MHFSAQAANDKVISALFGCISQTIRIGLPPLTFPDRVMTPALAICEMANVQAHKLVAKRSPFTYTADLQNFLSVLRTVVSQVWASQSEERWTILKILAVSSPKREVTLTVPAPKP